MVRLLASDNNTYGRVNLILQIYYIATYNKKINSTFQTSFMGSLNYGIHLMCTKLLRI